MTGVPARALPGLALLAACAYRPTRLEVLAPSREVLDRAVVEAISRVFHGLAERDAGGGRFVSRARADPRDPLSRWRGFVRVLPEAEPWASRPARGDSSFRVEVSVVRESLSRYGSPRPSWAVKEVDRGRERRLAEEIERIAGQLAGAGP